MEEEIIFSKNSEELSNKLINKISEICKGLEKFTIAVSGGSLPKFLTGLNNQKGIDFNKWWVFFADERVVPLDHQDSNYLNVKEAFLDDSTIPKDHIITINPNLNLEECAEDYYKKISMVFSNKKNTIPSFDLILLGIGPDGHICSLFPRSRLLESKLVVDYISDSPKPPPERITLTIPVLNNANNVIFVCSGDGKADIIKQVLHNKNQDLPACKGKVLSSMNSAVFTF